MNVAILGSGSWGTALATLVAEAGHRPKLGYLGKRPTGFPGSANLAGVIKDTDLIFIAAHPEVVGQVICDANPGPRDKIVMATRGLDTQTGGWLTDTVTENSACVQVGALAGPALASEVLVRQPCALVVASHYSNVSTIAQQVLHSSICRVYTSSDLRGVELAGTMVDVLSIAMGLSDGLQFGIGSRGVIVTRGLAECTRLGRALGAQESTFAGLAGVGEVVACGSHPQHPGYAAGLSLGRGDPVCPRLRSEVSAIIALAKRHSVDIPLTQAISAIISGTLQPRIAIDMLMRREATSEDG